MSTEQKIKLSKEWEKHLDDAETARIAGQERLAQSYEGSSARIEDKLSREDIDPRDWLK